MDDINQVVVNKLFNNPHFNASKFQVWDSYLDDDGNDTEVNIFRIPAKPNAGTRSIGVWASAKNRGTQALSKGASAEGKGTVAAGSWSHAEGNGTYAAYSSHAEGVGTKALGQGVHTEGQNTEATYWASHAEGTATQALNNSAHSEGDNTKALGTASHSEGKLTEASGNYSHSEGESCKAIGKSSHAEGTSTQAKGVDSHTEGYLSVAEGAGCHAEGYNTRASNSYSHAEGQDTVAMGWASHAAGTGTVAVKSSHTTVGNYNDWKKYENWTADKSIIPYFTVGNGTSDTDRKNAFEVFADGHAELQTVGTTDASIVTRSYVSNEITDVKTQIKSSQYRKIELNAANNVEINHSLYNCEKLALYLSLIPADNSLTTELTITINAAYGGPWIGTFECSSESSLFYANIEYCKQLDAYFVKYILDNSGNGKSGVHPIQSFFGNMQVSFSIPVSGTIYIEESGSTY